MKEWHLEYNFRHRTNGYRKWLVMRRNELFSEADSLFRAWLRMRKLRKLPDHLLYQSHRLIG